jgi:hypothetical protein
MNLAEFRHSGPHDEYVKVGQCLKNIHPYDLEDIWLDFMEQTADEGRKNKARNKWNEFVERVDGERLGEGSLRFWSQTDNYERYKEIEESNVDRLVDEAAQTATENDVAHVVHAMYREKFVCASVRNNDWYMWDSHIWKNSENGCGSSRGTLAARGKGLPQEGDGQAREYRRTWMPALTRSMIPAATSCKAEKDRKQYSAVRLRLKTTSFKENVMRECKILFRDTKFLQKLDENKHLIAFTNGVFDTLGQRRDGRERQLHPPVVPRRQAGGLHQLLHQCGVQLSRRSTASHTRAGRS